jgi:hypothetical protein
MVFFLAERASNRYIQFAQGHSSHKPTEMDSRATLDNKKTMESPLDSWYDTATFESDNIPLPT